MKVRSICFVEHHFKNFQFKTVIKKSVSLVLSYNFNNFKNFNINLLTAKRNYDQAPSRQLFLNLVFLENISFSFT